MLQLYRQFKGSSALSKFPLIPVFLLRLDKTYFGQLLYREANIK